MSIIEVEGQYPVGFVCSAQTEEGYCREQATDYYLEESGYKRHVCKQHWDKGVPIPLAVHFMPVNLDD